ncbi:MAG TPA: hypothetical protein VNQ73_00440 [Ilumatobacter sp.]|nr:hypothetical protein [Ilumatobacter sp.]
MDTRHSGDMRAVERRRWLLIAGVVAAAVVKARFGWVPVWYLALVVAVPAVGWWAARRCAARAALRWTTVGVAAVVTVALFPVPWMVAADGSAPGNAWRLDGRVTIEGRMVDPEGDWYWLTAGRPPTVAEVAWSKVAGAPSDVTPSTMRAGPLRQRSRWSEPAAAAVGLARGGWEIGTQWEAHVSRPTVAGLPATAVVVALNGQPLANAAFDGLGASNTFTTAAGQTFGFSGPDLPYEVVDTVVAPTRHVDVVVGGWLARTPVGGWWRNLATGSSHGLMVALVAYTHASGDELGRGLTVAGTGSMRPDGSVGRIGGLRAKATAAREAGADVLLYPAAQQGELEGFANAAMELVPVVTLDDAIAALQARHA